MGKLPCLPTFYTSRLGFTLNFKPVNEPEQEAYAILELGDTRVSLNQDLAEPFEKPETRKPYGSHFYFAVDDLKKSVEPLKREWTPIIKGPLEIPWGRNLGVFP